MKRISITLVAVIALLFSLTPVTFASTDTLHSCEVGGNTLRWAGMEDWGYNGVATRGVSAVINPNFALCNYNESNEQVSNWVAIIPIDASCGGCVFENSLIQVGIVLCNYYSISGTCEYGIPHFAYAFGGCNGAQPIWNDLGAADYNQHTYEIRHVSSPVSAYHFYIDGTYRAGILVSNSSINCWISLGHQMGTAESETHDLGNSFGDSNAQTIFSSVRYRNSDGVPNVKPWSSTGWPSNYSPCDYTGGIFTCDVSNSIHDQFYTWTNP